MTVCKYVLPPILAPTPLNKLSSKELEKCPKHNLYSIKIGRKNEVNIKKKYIYQENVL